MPRPLRPIADGLVYHVINRGNNRQDVFHKPGDYQAFLQSLADIKESKPFELYGYCLMSNHFHLLLRPTGASISRILQSLLITHTQRYHKHHRSGGHVWQGRFKSPVVQNVEHLLAVLRYIEANPLRARLVKRAEDYRWSSYRLHGCGEVNELLDRLVTYDELSPYAQVRQRKWAETSCWTGWSPMTSFHRTRKCASANGPRRCTCRWTSAPRWRSAARLRPVCRMGAKRG